MDRIDDLFDKQVKLQNIYYENVKIGEKRPELVAETVAYIIGEIGEILEEYQEWKTWRKNKPKWDEKNLINEVVDLWHFILNLTIFLGLDSNTLYEGYCKKNKINYDRQVNGY